MTLRDDPRLRAGVDLFNHESFFEAHEVWEELWHETVGEGRDFLQGLIQVTSAMHHFQNGNMRGAVILYRSGQELLAPYGARYAGVNLESLRRQFDRALRDAADRPLDSLAGRAHPHLFRIPYTRERAFSIEFV